MFQVVVLPPAETMGDVEAFRRLHDPAFHRIAAHLPLVPPFDGEDGADPLSRFDRVAAPPAFDVGWGVPAAAGRALVLPVTDGAAHVVQLRRDFGSALLPPIEETSRAAPALRLGLFGSDAEIELARRAFATQPLPPAFRVRDVALLVEDERGLWHFVRGRNLLPGRQEHERHGERDRRPPGRTVRHRA